MKRFPLDLPIEMHEEFYRCYPTHGRRSDLLRACIRMLIKRAKVAGEAQGYEVENVAAEVATGIKIKD